MRASPMTRRAAAANLAVFALLAAGSGRSAIAQLVVRFREIRVDVSPLRASAGDPTADWVEQELPGNLARALAAYLSPGERSGATLVARIRSIYLGPSSGGTGSRGASEDSIEGRPHRQRNAWRGPRRNALAGGRHILPGGLRSDSGRASLSRASRSAGAGLCGLGAEGARAITAR
jgi:hypothetical protein